MFNYEQSDNKVAGEISCYHNIKNNEQTEIRQ